MSLTHRLSPAHELMPAPPDPINVLKKTEDVTSHDDLHIILSSHSPPKSRSDIVLSICAPTLHITRTSQNKKLVNDNKALAGDNKKLVNDNKALAGDNKKLAKEHKVLAEYRNAITTKHNALTTKHTALQAQAVALRHANAQLHRVNIELQKTNNKERTTFRMALGEAVRACNDVEMPP